MKPYSDHRTARKTQGQHRQDAVQGLSAGTSVLTLDGALPVEFISAGDRVITRGSGSAVVRSVRARRHTGRAVRVSAGSLGHTGAEGDALLPAGQQVLLRDWRADALYGRAQALAPAERLVDDEFVTMEDDVALTLYEIEFDQPQILYAGGLEVASAATAA